jgi:arylsulfatase A-like enzyme
MNFKLLIVLLILQQSIVSSCMVETPVKPNILFIVTDDQGFGDLSIHGNPYLETPHLDRLGQQSVRFDRFYVNSNCAPSRAALLTGRYTPRTGTHHVAQNREAMRLEEVTIAKALNGAGYYSTCIGKWHNGIQYPYDPTGRGFDEFFGFTGGHINNYFDAELLRGTKPEKTNGYITDVLTDEAIDFINKNKDRPFFCYLAYNAPHGPWQVPDKYYDKFREKGLSEVVSAFWGMCKNIDDNVGRIIELIDHLGIAENTIVVFLTDNGAVGQAANVYNAGMRGWKTSVHEGGNRVPLFMRWPAAKWVPHVVETITAHIDLFPTLLDLAGIEPPPGPPVDGISLRPLLEGEGANWTERILFTHNSIDDKNRYPGAVRTPKYRLVRKIPGPQAGTGAKNNDANVLPWELYDMENDPGENENIADSHPEIVNELSLLYEDWFDDVSSEGMERFPLPVGYDEHNPVLLHASQAFFSDPVRYESGRGYANDWLTGWTNVQGKIWFEIDVVKKGNYSLEVALACPPEDAGSKFKIRAANNAVDAIVPPAPIVPVLLQDRASGYKERKWTILQAGSIDLPEGKHQLILEAVTKPGSQVMDFKYLSLERVN